MVGFAVQRGGNVFTKDIRDLLGQHSLKSLIGVTKVPVGFGGWRVQSAAGDLSRPVWRSPPSTPIESYREGSRFDFMEGPGGGIIFLWGPSAQ